MYSLPGTRQDMLRLVDLGMLMCWSASATTGAEVPASMREVCMVYSATDRGIATERWKSGSNWHSA